MKRSKVYVFFVALICMWGSSFSSALAHSVISSSPTTSCGSIDSTDFIAHATDQINSRLTLSSASTGLSVYTNRPAQATTSVWTRNPDLWTQKISPINLTGVSAWNDQSAYQRGATLITPRDFVTAVHFNITPGTQVVFVDNAGNPVVRTVINEQYIVDSRNGYQSDLAVETLDSDVPDSITYYPIIDANTLSHLVYKIIPDTPEMPILVFNQFGQAMVHSSHFFDNNYYAFDAPGVGGIGYSPDWIITSNYTMGPRAGYSPALIGGDSGQAGFAIVDGQLVVLFTQTGNGGPNAGYYISEINSALTSLGSPYQVTVYNPTCFSLYPTNHVPQFQNATSTLYVDQSKIINDPVATISATDQDAGQTLSYSLISLVGNGTTTPLNPASYFSINSSTGNLYQTQKIDTATYGGSFSLQVKVADNGQNSASSTATYTLKLFNFAASHIAFLPTYTTTLSGASTTILILCLIVVTTYMQMPLAQYT